MQTFLPSPVFAFSARILDWQRLGKQRVECKQILTALQNKSKGIKSGWQNHPATVMWTGYEKMLCFYAITMCEEWKRRGYNDNLLPFFQEQINKYNLFQMPSWMSWEPFHSSHRARLLDKDGAYYGKFNWAEQPVGPEGYVWPYDKHGIMHPLLEEYSGRKT